MQTFLPYSRFDSSAAVLDDLRLGKQRVETLQILRALIFPSYRGWKNHPATAMWRGFTEALVCYGAAMCAEWQRRGRADAVRGALLEFTGGTDVGEDELARRGRLPPWLGQPEFHASHRGALTAKLPEHYQARFADADPRLPYVWPRPMFPRWPVRRHEPLDVREAQAALGVDEASADEHLRAVLAALQAPGPTLWLHERAYEHAPPARDLAPAVVERPAGRVSPSVARPPTAQDLVSVAEEVTTPPLLRVHRLDAVRAPALRAAIAPPSLVVLEGVGDPDEIAGWFPGADLSTVG